jgi:hypothetical protein
MRRQTLFTLMACSACSAVLMSAHQTPTPPPAKPKRPGVTTPGVRIPMTKLKPDAIYDVPGAPDWMAID